MWVWLSATLEMHLNCDSGRNNLAQSLLLLEQGLARVSVGLAPLGVCRKGSRGVCPEGPSHCRAVVLCTEVQDPGLILQEFRDPGSSGTPHSPPAQQDLASPSTLRGPAWALWQRTLIAA